jgi:WD40 repeat protein
VKLPLKVRCALLALMLGASGPTAERDAQTRRPRPDYTHIVNAMKFSPDGRLLAIARGLQDDNRVELWDTETGALQRTIRGFDGPVRSVSFSPDGRTLLTGSSGVHPDKIAEKRPSFRNRRGFAELKWWDSQTGEFKQRLEIGGEDMFSEVAATYSPDGKFLAATDSRYQMRMGRQATVKLLDARTGETIFKLKDSNGINATTMWTGSMIADAASRLVTAPRRVATFSPDGKVVAAWNVDDIRLWASSSGEALLKLDKVKGQIKGIAFSPDSSSLAAAITKWSSNHDLIHFESEIRVWEIATGIEKQVIPLRTGVVNGPTFLPNGHQLLVAGFYGREGHAYPSMELVDRQSGSAGSIVSRDEGFLSAIEITHDGELMAFQTGISTVRLVDTRAWRSRYTFDANAESTSSSRSFSRRLVSVKSAPAVTFLPDGNFVVGELESGGIRVWDARTGEVKKTFAQDAETGSIAEISGNGSVLAEISGDEVVRVWNVGTGAHVELPSAKDPPAAVAVSGNGQVLAVAYANEIGLVNLNDPKFQPLGAPIQGNVVCLTLSFDGKLLAGATAQGDVQVWSSPDGKLQKNFPAGFGVSTMRFAPEGDVLALGGKDGRVSVWNLPSGAVVFDSRKHSAIVNAIAFSADGKLLATGSDDRTAIIWEVGSGKARRTLKGHDFTATSIAFSPGADLLAVGSGNASVVLWDVATGKLNRVMR